MLDYMQNNIGVFRNFINQLEKLVYELEAQFPSPKPAPVGDNFFVFRHDKEHRSDVLASYLKIVRIVSLLNASTCLIEKGFYQEVYILCRAIDEAVEDITFLALPIEENGASKKQIEWLEEFYQEQLSNPTDALSSTSRKRVGRKEIRAAISNLPIRSSDPHTRRKTTGAIHDILSGFVHGAYVFIMELFGGRVPKFHMCGMFGTPRTVECMSNFENHLYRSIAIFESVAHRSERVELALKAMKLGCDFAEMTKCLDEEEIQRLKSRIARSSLRPD